MGAQEQTTHTLTLLRGKPQLSGVQNTTVCKRFRLKTPGPYPPVDGAGGSREEEELPLAFAAFFSSPRSTRLKVLSIALRADSTGLWFPPQLV